MKKILVIFAIALVIALAGCAQQANPAKDNNQDNGNNGGGTVDLSKIVESGDTIKVEYKGTLTDGTEFDSSEKFGEPLAFEAGAGQMIKGFDAAVIGMRLNDEKTITLQPEEAYGPRDNGKIIEVSRENMADFNSLKVGMTVSSPEAGNGTIIELKKDSAKIDFNHPMAGKTLIFWIKVVEITKKK